MSELTPDLQYALSLLREVDDWEGGASLIDIDPVCAFKGCGAPLSRAFAMLTANRDAVNLLCLCQTHSVVLWEALAIHRKQA